MIFPDVFKRLNHLSLISLTLSDDSQNEGNSSFAYRG